MLTSTVIFTVDVSPVFQVMPIVAVAVPLVQLRFPLPLPAPVPPVTPPPLQPESVPDSLIFSASTENVSPGLILTDPFRLQVVDCVAAARRQLH